MSLLRPLVAATALSLTLAGTAAIAQPYYPDEGATVGGVTVYAPRTIGRSTIGAPIRIVREQRVVYAGDLDLRTYWGHRVLRSRIERAARDACDDLEFRYPVSADSGQDCYGQAVRGAYDQVAYRTGSGAYYAGY